MEKKNTQSEGYEKPPSLYFTLTSKLNSLQNQCDVQTLRVQAFRNNSGSSSVRKRGTESRAAMFRLAVCSSSLRLLLLTTGTLVTDGHDVILSSFDVVDFVSLAPFCSIYNPAPSSLPTLVRPNSGDGQIVI
jgi:hypothetical protein